jgi:hypothetical protein
MDFTADTWKNALVERFRDWKPHIDFSAKKMGSQIGPC